MKSFSDKKNFSVFSKILLGFLLVVAPLYFFGIQIGIWGQNDIRKEIIESYRARTSFYLASLENEFSSILKAQTKMIVDSDLIQLTSASKAGEVNDYQYFKEINTIRNMLRELKETSSLVDSASIYIPSVNLKISNLSISDMQEEDFNRMKALTAERVLPFNKMEDGYYINITSSDSYLTKEGASIDFIIFSLYRGIMEKMDKNTDMKSDVCTEVYFSLSVMFFSHMNRCKLMEDIGSQMDLSKLTNMEGFSAWSDVIQYFANLAEKILEQKDHESFTNANRIFRFIKNYVDQHIDDDLSLTRFADLLHFHPFYLSRLFKQVTGKSLSEYILRAKAAKAREMLKNSNLKVNEIAVFLGFRTASYFTSFFKNYTGLSPKEYRNLHWGDADIQTTT